MANKLGKKDQKNFGPIWLEHATWEPPGPWEANAYAELRGVMNSIPEGDLRDDALKRIKILDCGKPDVTLASCDPDDSPPPEALVSQKQLAAASADDTAYAIALATELRGFVCKGDDAIHILCGIIQSGRLAETGREAPALVDFIMSKDYPVSASPTGDDKVKLLKIKQHAEQKSAPPPTSQKEERATGSSHAHLRAPAMRSDPNPLQNYQRSISSLLKDLCTLKPLKHFLLLPLLITLFVKISRAVATTPIACCEPFKALMAV